MARPTHFDITQLLAYLEALPAEAFLPSYRTLGLSLGKADSTIDAGLNRLERAGHITRERQAGGHVRMTLRDGRTLKSKHWREGVAPLQRGSDSVAAVEAANDGVTRTITLPMGQNGLVPLVLMVKPSLIVRLTQMAGQLKRETLNIAVDILEEGLRNGGGSE